MEQNPLAKGFYFDKPREGAPDFIKARISVKVTDAIEMLNTYKNDKDYVNLELLKKKDGTGHYLQVNTYGLDVKESNLDTPEIKDEDVPF